MCTDMYRYKSVYVCVLQVYSHIQSGLDFEVAEDIA